MPKPYPYSQKNLIDFPIKYQMTSFEGKEFLLEFFKFRLKISEKIKPKEIISFKNLIKYLEETNKHYTGPNISTQSQLATIVTSINNNSYSDNDKLVFEKYLKKFEIRKILFDEYTKDFSSNLGSDKNYRNYLLLSLSCILLYSKQKNLKFLNTCLKVNDTLCSVVDSIYNKIDKLLFFYSLEFENNAILDLIKSKGLKI